MLLHYLIVFFVSMVPLIELRGAIPFSQGFGLPLIPSYIISIIGNMLPVPVMLPMPAARIQDPGATIRI